MKAAKYYLFIIGFFAFFKAEAQNGQATITPVLQNYFGVEKALVNDNSQMANSSAAELVKAVKEVKTNQLNSAQQTAWNKYSEKLRYNAQHISESKSIDHQREHFISLSDDMYALLKTFKPAATVYRQYCPMKKQFWLNPSATIQNPYYGKNMLDCGKVTETIKGNSK